MLTRKAQMIVVVTDCQSPVQFSIFGEIVSVVLITSGLKMMSMQKLCNQNDGRNYNLDIRFLSSRMLLAFNAR